MHYCGVCKSIGRRYGLFPRLGLVNEFGMLALILTLLSMENRNQKVLVKGCVAHPWKKAPSVIDSQYVDYAADLNVAFVYYKLLDSWKDDKNVFAKAGSALCMRRAAAKAEKRIPQACQSIRENLNLLSSLESEKCDSIDAASDTFASLMRDIFLLAPGMKEALASGSEYDTAEKLVSLGNLGYYIGKWVYIVDALYDLEEDRKHGSYNPILLRYRCGPEESTSHFTQRIQDDVLFLLNTSLGMCCDAWQILTEDILLDFSEESLREWIHRNRDANAFMENVLYLGMRGVSTKPFLLIQAQNERERRETKR